MNKLQLFGLSNLVIFVTLAFCLVALKLSGMPWKLLFKILGFSGFISELIVALIIYLS